MKTVFMFSGQGSQYFQMGRPLYESPGPFREWMQRMDRLVLDLCGHSVLAALYDPDRRKADAFDQTALSHPAIFMVEYALAQALIEADVVPDLVLGASLGSMAALALGGGLSVEEALAVVVRQAALLESDCQPGGMIAVLAEPALHAREELLRRHSEVSAVNLDAHFVLSAPQPSLPAIEAFLKDRKLSFQRLPVAFAFHSQWIDEIRADFLALVGPFSSRALGIPLACCAQARVVGRVSDKDYWSILRQPIRLRDTIAQLERSGPHRYIDAGPSGTLATLVKYALAGGSRSCAQPVMSPFGRDLDSFAAAAQAARRAPVD